MRAFILLLLLNTCFASVVSAATLSQTFTVDGQLFLTGTTTPLLDGTAKITVYIMDPSGTCLLYAEEQTVDTVTSNGYFNVQVGSNTGAGKRVGGLDPGRTMVQVYSNNAAIAANNVPGQTCAGSTYTPANGDGRLVRVIVTPTAGIPDTLTPDLAMDLAPMSKVAETIQGLPPASLLQVNNSGSVALTQANLESAFTGSAWTNIQAVMAGTYGGVSSVSASAGSANLPSISFSGDANTGFYSAGANQIGIAANGTALFSIGASGMVSATTGGAAVTTAAGTAAEPTFGFAGDAGLGWYRPAASTLAAATSGIERIRITSTGDLRINGSTSGYVGLRAPAVAGSGILTLPATVGTSGQTLVTDGSGVLSWATVVGGSGGSSFPIALGTSAAPSMNFSGDTNTGIYSPGADLIAISTSGTERLRISATGNVGIGVTTPLAYLHFKDKQYGDEVVRLEATNSDHHVSYYSGESSLFMKATYDLNESFSLGYDSNIGRGVELQYGSRNSDIDHATYPASMEFAPRGQLGTRTALHLDKSGWVGVGKKSPGAQLDVKDTIRISGSTSGYVGLKAPAAAGSTTYTLPSVDGSAGQVLSTDGSGVLSWATASGGGGGFPVALGTSAAPSMNFSGDTNTGIYSPGADTVAISTSGTERLRVSSTGAVGIGTTAPASLLQVGDSGGFNFSVAPISSADGMAGISYGADMRVAMSPNGNSVSWPGAMGMPGIRIGINPNYSYLVVDNAGNLQINGAVSGYVGIGTTSPGAKLDVKDTIHISGSTSGYVGLKAAAAAGSTVYTLPSADGSANAVLTTNGTGILSWATIGSASGVLAADGSAAAPSIAFSADTNTGLWRPGADTIAVSTSGLERMRVDASGYVGIGTTNPDERLVINNGNLKIANSNYLLINTNGAISYRTSYAPNSGNDTVLFDTGSTEYLTLATTGAAPINFFTNATERLRIDPSGKVGIGTTAPTAALDIVSPLNGVGLKVSSSGGLSMFEVLETSGNRQVYISDGSTTGMTIGPNGSGIQLNANNNAPVSIHPNATGTSTSSTLTIGSITTTFINPSTAVGIGTTSPGAKLDVKDTIHISGSTSGYVGLKAAAAAGSTVYTLPSVDGSANQVLTTDGTGVLSWTTASGGGTTGIALGSAGTPSISFSGDLNTGIYSPAAENVAISTSGVERLRVNSSGYVGIGTTNLTGHLTIDFDSGEFNQPGLVIRTYSGGTTAMTIEPGSGGNGYVSTGMSVTAAATGISATGTGGSSVGVAASGGATGVNGSTFSGVGVKGDGGGGGGVGGYFLGDAGVGLRANSVTGRIAEFQSNGTTKAIIDNSGYVGIGTTAPTKQLHLANPTSNASMMIQAGSSSTNPELLFTDSSGNGYTLFAGNNTNRNFYISSVTNGSWTANLMTVSTSGNVGIGTTSPGASLDVKDTIRISGSTSGYVGFRAPAAAGSTTYTLPSADGSVNQVLTTDGSGVLSWTALSGGSAASSVLAADGSVSAPSIAFSADTDTGLWRPGADTIAVSTSGVERVRITDAGNVGIGTTNVNSRLEIYEPSTNDTNIYLSNAGGMSLWIGGNASETWWWNGANSSTTFYTNNVERMRISAAGNVGIGVTTPGVPLHVRGATGSPAIAGSAQNGVARFGGTTGGNGLDIGVLSGSPYSTWMQSGYTVDYSLAAYYPIALNPLGGNVGIGTTSPGDKLEVTGGISSKGSDVDQFLRLNNTTAVTGRNYYITSTSTGLLQTWDGTAGAARMTLDASGNVGIGTGLPTDGLLHLHGGATTNVKFTNSTTGVTASDGMFIGLASSADTDGYVWNREAANIKFGTSNVERMRIDVSGNVGIGTTTPTTKLFINSSDTDNQITIQNTDSSTARAVGLKVSNYGGASSQPGSVQMYNARGTYASSTAVQSGDLIGQWVGYGYGSTGFKLAGTVDIGAAGTFSDTSSPGFIRLTTTASGATTPTERMRIDASGNVGIGATNPTARLEVAGGDIRINGSTSGYVGLRAPAVAGSGILTLPSSVGTSGQTLVTDGSGVLSWAASGAAGVFPIALGTSAAPSMNFTGDTDTGIYSPGADTIAISTSGVERLRVNASGNVGVGTTAPAARLHSQPAGQGTLGLFVGNSTYSTAAFYGLGMQVDDTGRGIIRSGWGTAKDLIINDNGGNVGVGTTNPGTKLQVAGVISPSADNTYDLGTSALRFKDIYAANNVIQTSDARLKTDVKDSDLGLGFINNLRPVSYYWKEGDPKLHYGVIAQETEKALSDAKKLSGRENEVDNVIVTHDEKTDRFGVRYTELIAPIIKAIQELYNELMGHDSRLTALEEKDAAKDRSIASKADKAETEALKAENEKLKQENAAQAKQLDAMKAYLCAKDPNAAICK